MAARSKSTRHDKNPSHGEPSGKGSLFGLPLRGAFEISKAPKGRTKKGGQGRILYFGVGVDPAESLANLGLSPWVLERAKKKRGEVYLAPTEDGPLWLVQPRPLPQLGKTLPPYSGTEQSPYGTARDLAGNLGAALLEFGVEEVVVEFIQETEDERMGFFVGLELGAYRFKTIFAGKSPRLPKLLVQSTMDVDCNAQTLAASMNLARHLVNLPANELNTKTFAQAVQELFRSSKHTTVEVWTGEKLVKERMGLLSAVGGGAKHGPALVHISYRSGGSKKTKNSEQRQPIAFVGKGVTFDSGGLDIKDAGSMRLMKKDMGGAASVTALAWWLDQTQLPIDCDFYLALAENSIDKNAFRPGDIIKSRQGLTVEIDNTDAEGRLILADALDVALSGGGGAVPGIVIDLATLTGAMRVALGTKVGGMFANHDHLAQDLLEAAAKRADPTWRMPLVAEYGNHLKSNVADLANSGPNRFGGAISAAIFLQKFVSQVPWAHFDIYCWSEGNGGGCTEVGGNGQAIQLLSHYLEKKAHSSNK